MPDSPLKPTPQQLAVAQRNRTFPQFPASLGHPVLRRLRRQPKHPLASSYIAQSFLFTLGDVNYAVRPVNGVGKSSPMPMPMPFHIIGAWHRNGAASTWPQCQESAKQLDDRLVELGVMPTPAAAVAGDTSWFETVSLAPCLDDGLAIRLGREFGQAAVIRIDETSLTVLPTGLRRDVVGSSTRWQVRAAERPTCPVRADNDPIGRCTGYGGPYGSSAIHAAALWQAHRFVALSAIGCGPCADGTSPDWGHGGRAVNIGSEIVLGGRYGGYTWMPER